MTAFPASTVVVPPTTTDEASTSAVSWAAIFAGAFAALALTVVLTSLGSGLGLTTISAWPNTGASVTTFTISAGVAIIVIQWLSGALGSGVGLTTISAWPNAGASVTTFTISAGVAIIVIQWLSGALGGFVAGRLRTKWSGVHTHEIFFRDTAHGFLSWALATVVGTFLLAAAASSVVSGGVHAASTVAGGAVQAAASSVSGYSVDSLFRSDHFDGDNREAAAQATRILANGVRTGDVPQGDRTYLAQLVAAKAGISQADAQKRVDDTIAATKDAEMKARQAADAARKATATFAIFMALSLMVGAFVASAAAAYGGSVRDEY